MTEEEQVGKEHLQPCGSPFRIRWAVNAAEWQPAEEEFNVLASKLPEVEKEAVRRFKFMDDKKRVVPIYVYCFVG